MSSVEGPLSKGPVCFLFLHLNFALLEKLYKNNNRQYYPVSNKVY